MSQSEVVDNKTQPDEGTFKSKIHGLMSGKLFHTESGVDTLDFSCGVGTKKPR